MADAGHILEMLQRTDDEAMMWSLQCLEQMNERLALSSDAREILHHFPPAAFVPALCGILQREVKKPVCSEPCLVAAQRRWLLRGKMQGRETLWAASGLRSGSTPCQIART